MSRVQGVVVVGCIIDVTCSLFNLQHYSHSLALRTLLPYCSFLYVSNQSRKNPVSASAMLTGKFLQIRKVFATSSLLAEEFPDTLQYKISR